jgi:molybdenum cofactor biosynthesis protein MoaC
LISKDQIAKGNVFATARIAGIQAAKQTAQLIPLCHTLPLSEVKIDVVTSNNHAEVKCTARTAAQTGVDMEALTGVATALLTIYDMQSDRQRNAIVGYPAGQEDKTGTVGFLTAAQLNQIHGTFIELPFAPIRNGSLLESLQSLIARAPANTKTSADRH